MESHSGVDGIGAQEGAFVAQTTNHRTTAFLVVNENLHGGCAHTCDQLQFALKDGKELIQMHSSTHRTF